MITPWITAIGEALWDMLPAGKQLGGAPANFAVHAKGLGAIVTLVSRVGTDDLGRELCAQLERRGVWSAGIQRDAVAPTGIVDVEVDAAGQPRYAIRTGAAWDRLEADVMAGSAAVTAHAVCFGSFLHCPDQLPIGSVAHKDADRPAQQGRRVLADDAQRG